MHTGQHPVGSPPASQGHQMGFQIEDLSLPSPLPFFLGWTDTQHRALCLLGPSQAQISPTLFLGMLPAPLPPRVGETRVTTTSRVSQDTCSHKVSFGPKGAELGSCVCRATIKGPVRSQLGEGIRLRGQRAGRVSSTKGVPLPERFSSSHPLKGLPAVVGEIAWK